MLLSQEPELPHSFCVAELILGPQDWGDQPSLCVLRAKSKDGFAGPQAIVSAR